MIGRYFAKLEVERDRAARQKRPVRWFRFYVAGQRTKIRVNKIHLS